VNASRDSPGERLRDVKIALQFSMAAISPSGVGVVVTLLWFRSVQINSPACDRSAKGEGVVHDGGAEGHEGGKRGFVGWRCWPGASSGGVLRRGGGWYSEGDSWDRCF
jgi:hypothetical protein